MNRRVENSESIPNDLVFEISSRLPSKSVARFRCVSKLWGYMLSRPYFTELFLTRSWARPRLLFTLYRDDEWSFFSSPQLQNPYDGKVSVGFHMKLSKDMCPEYLFGLTSGLIYIPGMNISRKKDEDAVLVVFNPTTTRYAILPKLRKGRKSESYLGLDPIDKQFKVLSMALPRCGDHKILTLGTGLMRWRKIECPLAHEPLPEGICIKGVLYYLAVTMNEKSLLVFFDVRSEEYKFIETPFYNIDTLINYKGKLGTIYWIRARYGKIRQWCLWVLDDVEKQEWSEYVYTLPDNAPVNPHDFSFAGVASTGEIVLSMKNISKPLYVFYFNPERNTSQSVEIQGFREYYDDNDDNPHYVDAFVDYVEDLHVNDAEYLKSSQCLNIIRERPKLPKPQTNM